MRWKENFAAILRDQGFNLSYTVSQDEQGHFDTKIMVEFQKDGILTKKDIKQYLTEEVDSSLHELIRGNVLLATRYFNDRVKKFMDLVVMGDNNPMMVEYYTYKVEFQDRGAGHIHGTLWLKLDMIERLIRTNEGTLVLGDEMADNRDMVTEDTENNEKNFDKPFQGLSSTFRKLKNNEVLLETEKEALKNFIDEFTTVCTVTEAGTTT